MSRAYRIQVSESLTRVVHVDDGVATKLELLPILPKERMQALLADELAAAGLAIQDGLARRTSAASGGDVTLEVELASGTVTVRIAHEESVVHKAEAARTIDLDRQAEGEARLREELARSLERKVEATTEELRRRATMALEGALRDARDELDRVVHRVTAAALKEKARSLGEIEELSEDEASGTLTIKVRV